MTDEERDEEEEPEQNGGLFDEPDEAPADDGTPESAGAAAPATQESSEGGDGGEEKSKRLIWPWVVLGAVVGLLLLVGWTKVVNSDSYCTRCHTNQAAADTAANSVHSEVSCMACHRGVGIPGAVAYIPTFLREVVDQLTPIPLASGTMDAAPCEKCHDTIFTTPLLEGEHPSTGCNDCHGDTAHPQPPAPLNPTDNPHPEDWIAFHGREANKDLNVCATCHLLGDNNITSGGTCMACHFRGQYPHPKNWIPQHGQEQLEQGPDACTLCHAPTFCKGCHGTEIPHQQGWLKLHPTETVQNQSAELCLTCHAPADCTYCHVRHDVHPEQGLYYETSGSQP